MNNNQNRPALPGTNFNFPGMGDDSHFGGPPVYQHFTGPSSTFINVFRQPGNYSIEMAFGRGSTFANIGHVQARGPLSQAPAMGTGGLQNNYAGPTQHLIRPPVLNVPTPLASQPPSAFAPVRSPVPGPSAVPVGPQNDGDAPEQNGNDAKSNYNLRRVTN